MELYFSVLSYANTKASNPTCCHNPQQTHSSSQPITELADKLNLVCN